MTTAATEWQQYPDRYSFSVPPSDTVGQSMGLDIGFTGDAYFMPSREAPVLPQEVVPFVFNMHETSAL
jgi:hypothetical protein